MVFITLFIVFGLFFAFCTGADLDPFGSFDIWKLILGIWEELGGMLTDSKTDLFL